MEIKQPPVKVGEVIKESIKGFGASGDPFIKVDHYVIFLNNAKGIPLGKMFYIRITKTLDKFGFAELAEWYHSEIKINF